VDVEALLVAALGPEHAARGTQERVIGDAGERAAARGRGWWSPNLGPGGIATFMFETLTQLHAALDRAYKLASACPTCHSRASAPRRPACPERRRPSAWSSSASARTYSATP
jgi:hypothetical protein